MKNTYYGVGVAMHLPFDESKVEEIATRLMECSAETDESGENCIAVSLDLEKSEIEIDCIVTGQDAADAMANASIVIHGVCNCAGLQVRFTDGKPRRPVKWTVVEAAAAATSNDLLTA